MSIRTAQQKQQELLNTLYPVSEVPGVDHDNVNYHLLAAILALAVRDDVLANTLPASGGANPNALTSAGIGVDASRIPDEAIQKLAKYREHFAGIQRAWLEISGYEDPPCPNNVRMTNLVDATKNL